MSAPTSLLLLLHKDLPESSHQWEDLHDFQAAYVACETARFVLEADDDDILVRCETMDKNKTTRYYTQGQEDHPTQQSPSFGDSDGILSCWKTGPEFSFFGCDLQVVQPTNWERGSSRIPNREQDEIVSVRTPQRHAEWLTDNESVKILAPKPERSSKVRLEEVRELETIAEKLVETRETDLLVDT